MTTLYHAPMSSASPLVWAMAELGIDHESVKFDLQEDRHKQPEFLAINPMGQVPTLVDDGQPMFEGSAIATYLGERYGVERGLWPAVGSPQHMVALTWIAWTAVTLQGALRQMFISGSEFAPEEMQNAAIYERARARFKELIAILDAHLSDRDYVTGSSFTLADVYCAAGLRWATGVVGVDLGALPYLEQWLDLCLARPAAAAMG